MIFCYLLRCRFDLCLFIILFLWQTYHSLNLCSYLMIRVGAEWMAGPAGIPAAAHVSQCVSVFNRHAAGGTHNFLRSSKERLCRHRKLQLPSLRELWDWFIWDRAAGLFPSGLEAHTANQHHFFHSSVTFLSVHPCLPFRCSCCSSSLSFATLSFH